MSSGLGTRRKGKKETWDLCIPEYLALRVKTLMIDPSTRKPLYGGRSGLVTELLEKWASEQEARLASQGIALPAQPSSQQEALV